MHLLLHYLDGALPDLHFVSLPLPSVANKFMQALDSICAIVTALDFLRMDIRPNDKTQISPNKHSEWQVLLWESVELYSLTNRYGCNSLSRFLPHLILTTYTRLLTAGTRHQVNLFIIYYLFCFYTMLHLMFKFFPAAFGNDICGSRLQSVFPMGGHKLISFTY